MKSITIEELARDKKASAVWVLNSSVESVLEAQGEVLLSIPNQNGSGYQPVRIKQTWLPQDLTAFCSKAQLLGSAELRDAIRKDLLTLIDNKTAQSILNEDGASEEAERVDAEEKRIRAAQKARTISDSGAHISRADGTKEEDIADDFVPIAKVASTKRPSSDDELTPSFLMFVDKLVRMPDTTCRNEIRARRKFRRPEVEHMLIKLAGKPETYAMLAASVQQKDKKAKK